MKTQPPHFRRLFSLIFTLLVVCTCLPLVGCRNGILTHKPGNDVADSVAEASRDGKKKEFFVGDVAVPEGLDWYEVTSVSLATNLANTGSDPPESRYRTLLLREMASQDVPNPRKVLASPTNSLVVVTGYIPPGAQKGDRFDLDVTLPPDSETTSLRGGYLLPSYMREIYMLDNVREGARRGRCSGPILVEPKTGTDRDKITQRRGQVLGGGVCMFTPPFGLRVRHASSKPDRYLTMKLEAAINRRFQIITPTGSKMNVAKARDDKYVGLQIPKKYRDNLVRFIEVVRCVPIIETEADRMERLARLQERLREPTTARRAALELEAIGRAGVDTLKTGLNSADPLVRFYSAQSLAYMDESVAAQVLGETALNDHANRAFALSALCALDDLYAYDELRKLMNAPTAETRYGAFRALSQMRPQDPLVKGESLGRDTFRMCIVQTEGRPMLHVTKMMRAEIVLFGGNQEFRYPFVVEGANNIVVRAISPTQIVVSRFMPSRPDQKRTVSMKVSDVIRALSDVGAQYPDVIEILQSAIAQNALDSSFRIDAIPSMKRNPNIRREIRDRMKDDTGDDAGASEEDVETGITDFTVSFDPGGDTPH